ncbi:hypothetical protein IPZ58_05105 [Streptomyces roseoverticillatus]|uniref:hypothetical protein n=1 Tax=Streptomyces roseoverticillatus TaxID=66429 RepID=UPI001F305856|nr:hypothetical protein [Streptomyces roseoverticillatus]MCF3100953.1 hypothetical protein [Streptomyces roseoverticillatus]
MSADCDGLCRRCTCPFPPAIPQRTPRAAQARQWHRDARLDLEDLADVYGIDAEVRL